MKKRNSLRGGIKRDFDSEKKHPNSVGAIARTVVRTYRLAGGEQHAETPRSPVQFGRVSRIATVYRAVLERFPGVITKRTPARDSETGEIEPHQVGKMFGDLGFHKGELTFTKLRTLADYLEISEAALFTITHLISIERRANTKSEARTAHIESLDAMQRLLDAAKNIVDNEQKFARIEGNDGEGKEIWVADVDRLTELVEAYSQSDLNTTTKLLERR